MDERPRDSASTRKRYGAHPGHQSGSFGILKSPTVSENESDCSLQLTSEPERLFNLLTVKEVAVALRVSRDTVYRLVDSRELTSNVIGGCMRIALDDLKTYVERSKRRAPNNH